MPSPVATLANTFGALEIGTLIAVCLFGIITIQTDYYFRSFREDKLWLKTTVLFMWTLELGHTVGICVEVYRTTIVFAGRPLEYNNFEGIGVATLLGGIITMIAQCFFSFRAWRLLPGNLKYIGLLFIVVSIIRCGFSSYLSHLAIFAASLQTYTNMAGWLITMLLSIGAGLDVFIATAMMYFFVSRRKNALPTTTRIVDRLLSFTIRTGLLTSITAVAVLISFQLAPHTYIWVGIYCCLAKLYSNSFLSALNDRQELRKTAGNTGVVWDTSSSNPTPSRRRHPSLSVVVDIKTERDVELQRNPGSWTHQFVEPSPTSSVFLDKTSITPLA